MLIVFGMCLNALPLFNSCTIFQSRSILFVYNRLIVSLMLSVARGSPLVFFFCSCGCIILYRPSLSVLNSPCDVSARSLLCAFSVHGSTFRVVSL